MDARLFRGFDSTGSTQRTLNPGGVFFSNGTPAPSARQRPLENLLEGGAPSPPIPSVRQRGPINPQNPDDTEVVPPTPATSARQRPLENLLEGGAPSPPTLVAKSAWGGQRKRTSSISRLKDSAFLLPIMKRTCVMVFPGKFGFSSRSPRKWGGMSLKGISRVCQSVPVWNSAW